jgi:hypothetical protein
MVKDISSPFRLDDVRGVVAGRGNIVGGVDELRGDFVEALGRSLAVTIPYHTLDEPAIAEFVRRLRELSAR